MDGAHSGASMPAIPSSKPLRTLRKISTASVLCERSAAIIGPTARTIVLNYFTRCQKLARGLRSNIAIVAHLKDNAIVSPGSPMIHLSVPFKLGHDATPLLEAVAAG